MNLAALALALPLAAGGQSPDAALMEAAARLEAAAPVAFEAWAVALEEFEEVERRMAGAAPAAHARLVSADDAHERSESTLQDAAPVLYWIYQDAAEEMRVAMGRAAAKAPELWAQAMTAAASREWQLGDSGVPTSGLMIPEDLVPALRRAAPAEFDAWLRSANATMRARRSLQADAPGEMAGWVRTRQRLLNALTVFQRVAPLEMAAYQEAQRRMLAAEGQLRAAAPVEWVALRDAGGAIALRLR